VPEWSPELVVDESLTPRLIGEGFPDVEPGRLTSLRAAAGADAVPRQGD
jgi:hypothetical protein